MQAKYGTYAFAAGSVKTAFSLDTRFNAGGQPFETDMRIAVDGYLYASGQSAIQQAVSALRTALSRPYQDFVVYRDDGSPSDMALYNATSTTGVVVKNLRFPDSVGNEYGEFRHFAFEVMASYPATGTAGLLTSFRESLSFSGGGPIYRHLMAINGKPQKQLVYPSSIYRVVQEGEAVGYLSQPTPPSPIWPTALMESPDLGVDSPQRRGKLYTDFRVTWRYNFESADPLVGTPNIWR